MQKRVILIVMDSVGIGEMPDAADFHDEGSHTLGNIYKYRKTLDIPNLLNLGLGNINSSGLPAVTSPAGAFGKAAERTHAKDTTSGHWELAGLPMARPLRTYPHGFPEEIIKEFEKRTGRKTLYNKPASGTEIIRLLGDAHAKTGYPIVYTSADSVFQIAAHEKVIPLDELYHMCEIARGLLVGDYLVGRVIARPFIGKSGAYTRTEHRRDFSIDPPGKTILDDFAKRGMINGGIGKIEDIFGNRSLALSNHTKNNKDSVAETIRFMEEEKFDFLFVNLVDFDMLYGHRNDVEGYARALERFDASVPAITRAMRPGDLLIITADHGCDPTTKSTDHSREYIPLTLYGGCVKPNVDIGTRKTFADVGATIYEYLTQDKWPCGESFLPLLEG
ncbi:MAG: phosphopentomutase [Clostridiales bacterium]|nr:phosphopentomutase [Clostridiales bacterium]